MKNIFANVPLNYNAIIILLLLFTAKLFKRWNTFQRIKEF